MGRGSLRQSYSNPRARKTAEVIDPSTSIRSKRSRKEDAVEQEISSPNTCEVILNPHPDDILFGRGPGVSRHNQGTAWRSYVDNHRADYQRAHSRLIKTQITKRILYIVAKGEQQKKGTHNTRSGGRFLQSLSGPASTKKKRKKTSNKQRSCDDEHQKEEQGWYEVDEKMAYQKTTQALRELVGLLQKQGEEEVLKKATTNKSISRSTLQEEQHVLEQQVPVAAGVVTETLVLAPGETDEAGDDLEDDNDLEKFLGEEGTANQLLLLAGVITQPSSWKNTLFSSTPPEESSTMQNTSASKGNKGGPEPSSSYTAVATSQHNDSSTYIPQQQNKDFLDPSFLMLMDADEESRAARCNDDGNIPHHPHGGGPPLLATPHNYYNADSPGGEAASKHQKATSCAATIAASEKVAATAAVPLTGLERGISNDFSALSGISADYKSIHGNIVGEHLHIITNSSTSHQYQGGSWPGCEDILVGVATTMPSNSQESGDSNEFTNFSCSLPSVSPMKDNEQHGGKHSAGGIQDDDTDDGGGKHPPFSSLLTFNSSLPHSTRGHHHRKHYTDYSENTPNNGEEDLRHEFSFAKYDRPANAEKKSATTTTMTTTTDEAEDVEVACMMASSLKRAPQKDPSELERTNTPTLVQTPQYEYGLVAQNATADATTMLSPSPSTKAARAINTNLTSSPKRKESSDKERTNTPMMIQTPQKECTLPSSRLAPQERSEQERHANTPRMLVQAPQYEYVSVDENAATGAVVLLPPASTKAARSINSVSDFSDLHKDKQAFQAYIFQIHKEQQWLSGEIITMKRHMDLNAAQDTKNRADLAELRAYCADRLLLGGTTTAAPTTVEIGFEGMEVNTGGLENRASTDSDTSAGWAAV